MSKIGLRVTKISSGVQELMTINGSEWTRKVVDIRTDIKVLSGKSLEEGDEDVMMLSFIPTGTLFTLFHTITGRSGDLVSAWIYFPVDISITDETELEIINKVRTELSKSQVESWSELETILSKDYPSKQCFQYRESATNGACAVRYYGAGVDFSLRELLGERIYQTYYAEHKYVFLLDKGGNIVADDKLVNYTDEPLKEWVIVSPPQLPAGISVKLNGKNFTNPIVVSKGDSLNLLFERQGFTPLASVVQASAKPIAIPETMPWMRHVTLESFRVIDPEHKELKDNCKIKLNGQPLGVNGMDIAEAECVAVKIELSCPYYENYTASVNLLASLAPVTIKMTPEKTEVIYLINNQECPNLKDCPPLYTVTHESRRQKTIYKYCEPIPQTNGDKWKKIAIIAAAAAFVLGILLGFAVHKMVAKSPQKQEKVEQNANEGTNNKPAVQVSPKEYPCLNKDTWKKEELEAEESLRGLFEDLYNGRFDKLTHEWCGKIDRNQNGEWDALLRGIEELKVEDLPKDFRYNGNGTEINTDQYINQLEIFTDNKAEKTQNVRDNSRQNTPGPTAKAPTSASTNSSSNKNTSNSNTNNSQGDN